MVLYLSLGSQMEPDDRGMEQQETFARCNGMEVPGQDLEHSKRMIDRSEGIARKRRDVLQALLAL